MADTTIDRILFRLKTRGPESVAALGNAFSITTEAVRQLMNKLEAEGLVAFEDHREGRGRPKRVWHLTEAGHARFPDRHAELTVELIDSLVQEFGETALDRLVKRREDQQHQLYQQALTPDMELGERVKTLADLRSGEGYMAEARLEEDGTMTLIENHCPICAAAAKCQSFCRSELEIFQEVLGEMVTVTRTDHIVAGARRCAYRIEPIEPGG